MSKTKPLAEDHPLSSAAWIWPEGCMYLYNHFAHFRRDFDLDSAPGKAPLFITADKAYKLYVNGAFVCRGPARGYQSHWPFDEVDVAPHLAAGHNWIAVEAYTPGIGTYQYIHRAQAGLLCAARWGDFELVTDDEWLCRRSIGHRVDTARYSVQMDFQEHVDARKVRPDRCSDNVARELDRDWITKAAPPSPTSWKAGQGLHGQEFSSSPFGRPPWEALEPRGIPLMREEIVTPAAVTAEATGACGEGYGEWSNVSWGWVGEGRKVTDWRDGSSVKAARAGEWLEIALEPAGEGCFRAVTIDVGRMICLGSSAMSK